MQRFEAQIDCFPWKGKLGFKCCCNFTAIIFLILSVQNDLKLSETD